MGAACFLLTVHLTPCGSLSPAGWVAGRAGLYSLGVSVADGDRPGWGALGTVGGGRANGGQAGPGRGESWALLWGLPAVTWGAGLRVTDSAG